MVVRSWAAADSGRIATASSTPSHRRTLLTIERPPGVGTNLAVAFTSATRGVRAAGDSGAVGSGRKSSAWTETGGRTEDTDERRGTRGPASDRYTVYRGL